MGFKVVALVLGAYTCCCVTAAPQVYQATGVLQPEARSAGQDGNSFSAVIDILPEITNVIEKINTDPGRSNPSDTGFVERVISAFMPISKKVLVASAKAEGRDANPDELEALNAAEKVMPAVFRFMESLRGTGFSGANSGSQRMSSSFPTMAAFQSQPPSPGTTRYQSQSTGNLGRYQNIVDSTNDVLPEISDVFTKIISDPARSDPSSPDFIQNVIMSFLPISRNMLLASARAEGRSVPQDELDRLNAAEAVMPSVFRFMENLRMNDFFGTGTAPESRTRTSSRVPVPQLVPQLPSAFTGVKPSFSEASAPAIPASAFHVPGAMSPVVPAITASAFQVPGAMSQVAMPYRYEEPEPLNPTIIKTPIPVNQGTRRLPPPSGIHLPEIILDYAPAAQFRRAGYVRAEYLDSSESSEEMDW